MSKYKIPCFRCFYGYELKLTIKSLLAHSYMLIVAMLIFSFSNVKAENIYLLNGEVLKGKIIEATPTKVVIESDFGYGYIDLPTDQILSITFNDNNRIDLARRYGIGYLSKNGPLASNDRFNYQVNQLSFRTYPNTDYFYDFLAGYSSYSFKNEQLVVDDKYHVAQIDVRLAKIFFRRDNMVNYLGGSIGYISWDDPQLGIKESGFQASFFIGAELFFIGMPDFGFSGELAVAYQKTDSLTRNQLVITPLPTLSVHFYF